MKLSTALALVVPIVAALPAPASSGPGTVAADGHYFQTVLDHHNVHRQNHSAPALTWSPSMRDSARILAQSCAWGHNTSILGGGYGQNIAAGSFPSQISGVITGELYNDEVIYYDWYGSEPDLTNFGEYGHFTQLVWKQTKQVGCYTADCSATGIAGLGPGIAPYFTVCNYFPSGNWLGEFRANVLKPIGMPSITPSWKPTTPSKPTTSTKPKNPTTTRSATFFAEPQDVKVGSVAPS